MRKSNLAIVESESFRPGFVVSERGDKPVLRLVDPNSENAQTARKVSEVSRRIAEQLQQTVREIDSVHTALRHLALDAKTQAIQAGRNGAAFAQIAAEINALSMKAERSALQVANHVEQTIGELAEVAVEA